MKHVVIVLFLSSLMVPFVDAAPNCAGNLNGTFIVGMDLTGGGNAPWESVDANGTLVGFDVQIACQLRARLDYANIQFLNIPDASLRAAVNAGIINVAISQLEIPAASPIAPTVAFVKYNDVNPNSGTQGIGIMLGLTCCQLYANIAAAIAAMDADGTLANLRNQFGILPNSYTPVAGLTPAGCIGIAAQLPTVTNIQRFFLNFCLPCAPVAPTTVTVIPA